MVSQMQCFASREIKPPNISLSPDNNVQVQMEATIQEMNIPFSSTWVQGHQDNKPIKELSWEAILNIVLTNLLPRQDMKQLPKVLHLLNCLQVKSCYTFMA
jgi:hypothetical protein